MGGNYSFLAIATFIILFSTMSFAQPNVVTDITPENSNITTFNAGYHEVYAGTTDWEDYTQVTINTSDFEIIGGSTTILLDKPFVFFEITGSTPGLKEYTLTFSGASPDFAINGSFTVDSEPSQTGGPIVLSDFDFSQTYENNQEVKFDCFGSLEYPANCTSTGEYMVGSEAWATFNFSSPITFTFDGTENIEIKATNEIGLSSTTQFNLTINKPVPVIPVVSQPSNEGSSSGGTYYIVNTLDEEEIEVEIDTNHGLETISEEIVQDTGENTNDEENTDFKEDITNNNSNTTVVDSGETIKTIVSVTQTGSMISFPDMTGFFMLSIPEVTIPEINPTGLVSVWMPNTELIWVPLVLVLAILVLFLAIGKKKMVNKK